MTIGSPTHYEQPSTLGGTRDAIRDIWWYINGSHPTETNSIPWECIEVWDGTTREVPSGGSMQNLSSGSLWRPAVSAPSTLPDEAWAIFRNPDGGAVAARFQVHVRMETTGRAKNSLITLDDWTVGAGTDASPTLPTTLIGQPIVGDDGTDPWDAQSTFIWSVLVDEGMYIMRQFNPAGGTTNSQWEYMGEVEPVNSEIDVPRPFVIQRTLGIPGWTGSNSHNMLSPFDQSTVLGLSNSVGLGYPVQISTGSGWGDLGPSYLSNVYLYATILAGSRFTVGYIRNAAAIDEHQNHDRATCGFTASDFRFEVWTVSPGAVPHIVTLWPPGTALAAGHTEVTKLSVPTQLVPPGGVETTPPVVTYIDPLPGAQIRADQAITIDVTNDGSGFANIQLRVAYIVSDPVRPTETIYGGDELGEFESFYSASTITSITNGFRFVIVRNGGWPSTPNFTASPIDSSGNIT